MAHLGLGSPSPVAPASPGRYLAGSPQTFASAVPESGAVAVEDDKRYRRSIHALEAEVDQLLSTAARGGRGISSLRETQRSLEITRSQLATELKGSRTRERELEALLGKREADDASHRSLRAEVEEARVEIARLRDALRAATAEAADARGERARSTARRPPREFSRRAKAASDAKHECARLRSACRSAQSDAERCVKRRVDAKIAQLEHDYRRDAHATLAQREESHAATLQRAPEHEQILATAKRVSEDRVKALTAELEGDRDRYAATLAKTTAMVDQRIEEEELDQQVQRERDRAFAAMREASRLESQVGELATRTSAAETRARADERVALERQGAALEAKVATAENATADAERVCASAEVHRQSLERRADEADRRREAAEAAALEANALAATGAELAEAQGARLEAELGAQDARRDAERALGAAKNAALEAEADARRLTLRCETAERSLSDATARSDGANAARLRRDRRRAPKRLEEAEAELGAAKLRSAEAESTGAALGDQRHRDASRIAELEQKLENFASAVNVAELAKKAAEQKLRAAHEGSAATEASTVAATRRAEDAEARSEKIMEQRGNSDRERQKLVARIASLERQLDFAAKARDDARKHAEDARALADEHANRHKELVSRHRALDAREVEIEHKVKLHERAKKETPNFSHRPANWARMQSDVTPIHMANLPGEQFRRSIIESDV
ncbi:hypothetical protein JL720_15957 [Aureococcus anophagefferens]|nr:hypothetical protein JL720_15957 [Aureococcus anophagefferens]